MKVALIGCKSLLDTVLLNYLSEEIPSLEIVCFGDSGSVSFGSKILNIQDIKKINLNNLDVIVHLSHEYLFVLGLVKTYNAENKKKVYYFNFFEGTLSLTGGLTDDLTDLVLLPTYSVEPIVRVLSIMPELTFVDIFINQPIAELGKESMHRFHKEIKDSALKINHYTDNKIQLAFNISYIGEENEDTLAFQDSLQEKNTKQQLEFFFKDVEIMLNQARVPVNKGASVVLSFNLKKAVESKILLKKLQEVGFLYVDDGFSTILAENDTSIYITKLKQSHKRYSMVVVFDSIQRMVVNVSELLMSLIEVKN